MSTSGLITGHWVSEAVAMVLALAQPDHRLSDLVRKVEGCQQPLGTRGIGDTWFLQGRDACGQKQYIHHSYKDMYRGH